MADNELKTCLDCNGWGRLDEEDGSTCKYCDGEGVVYD